MPSTSLTGRADEILEEVLDLQDADREAFLRLRCGPDEDLHRNVSRLLALAGELQGFLAKPILYIPDVRPGYVLANRFRVERKLGEGGMGSVFLVIDEELGPVALKTIRTDLRNNPHAIRRFRDEIRIARSVSHPNVCPIFDLHKFEHPGCGSLDAFTMKYLPGETLAARLSRGAMVPQEALRLAGGIAAGIDALHAQNIIHRDLKPGNIILTVTPEGDDTPVITDFGIAQLETTQQALSGAPLGSLDYMAPEQFQSAPLTRAADIYSFGLILHEMLTGGRPVPLKNQPGIPECWSRAIKGALANDPVARPQSARSVLALLEDPVSWFRAARQCRPRTTKGLGRPGHQRMRRS